MPQWTRDPAVLRDRYPDERWSGQCPRAHAALLLRYDHHVVWVEGRSALLLTYAWAADGTAAHPDPLTFEISFTYPRGHPTAPRDVQVIVERIDFTPVTVRTPRAGRDGRAADAR